MRKRIKVALIGSRGIPPRYGGAETFVYELSKRIKHIFHVYVTCETNHFGISELEGIKRVDIWASHTPTMTIPVIYDITATLYLLKKVRDIDLVYYVAPDGSYAAVLSRLARKKVVVNTDGIEWKRLLIRMKFVPWSYKPVYLLTAIALLVAEFMACKVPHITIADSIAVKKYLERKWRPKKVVYVAYGIRELPKVDPEEQEAILKKLELERCKYYLTIGRTVAENNIHVELEAFRKVRASNKLVIVGPLNSQDPYIRYLLKLRGNDERIVFMGSIYDLKILYSLRANCIAYIHPYTVGGTNPSLLEQLQFDRPIVAYDVPFHREILGEKGIYFKTAEELAKVIETLNKKKKSVNWNLSRALTWEWVAQRYREIFIQALTK